MKPSAALALFFAVLGIICLAIYSSIGAFRAAFAQADRPAPGILAVTAQATATAQPTGTASQIPTVDYSSTWPEATRAEYINEQARAAERLANAEAKKAEAAKVQVWATEQALVNAQMVGTPTAIARMTEQAVAVEQAQSDRDAAFIAAETARVMAAIEQDKQAEITRQNLIFVAWLIVGIVAGSVVIAIVFVLAYRAQVGTWQRAVDEAADEPLENLAPVSDAPTGFIPVGESGETRHPDFVPVPDDVFRIWAGRMLEGETAGIEKWENGRSPFSRDAKNGKPSYVKFLAWVVARGYIKVVGGAKLLSDRGRRFCSGWLARHPDPGAAVVETG